jgi:alpha-maltose-1-phosphate synthase
MDQVSESLSKLRDLDVSVFSVPSETSTRDKETLLVLQNIIRHYKSDYIYLEIGSHLGGTLVPHLIDPLCRHVYSVDKRPLSVLDERGVYFDYPDNSTHRMLDTLRQHVPPSAFCKLQTFDADISDVSKNQLQMESDLIFIDAEHTNVAVFRDFLNSTKFASQSFMAVFHDSHLLIDGIHNIETFLQHIGIPFKSYFLPDVVYAVAIRDLTHIVDEALQRISIDTKKFIERSRLLLWEDISNNMAVAKRGEIGHRTSVGSLNFVKRESGTRHLEEAVVARRAAPEEHMPGSAHAKNNLSETISPAVAFAPGGYEATAGAVFGLAVANQGFVQGLVRHGGLGTLHGYLLQAGLDTQLEQFARDLGATLPVRVIQPHRLDQLAELGVLHLGDPRLANAARRRSFVGHRAYALTGITHTLADMGGRLADLVAAPVQPWDALVCTSRAVLAVVEEALRAEEVSLAERLGAKCFPRPLLPVIPLGVDAARFTPRPEWRAAWRERLGIGAEEVAVLYVGRFTRQGKAHPMPMMAALGRAALGQKRPLHLILAGWWQYPAEEAEWRAQAAALCPEVRLHILDGREEAVRRDIRSAADIFTFLIDNIQETFGLAPVEAMAAGLPVVATNWDGLRDTVRHGVDGMLVPTLMAPPGEGLRAALYFATKAIDYYGYLSSVAQRTVVDIAAAADAFRALAADPALRRRMGEAGQARAREVFDWAAVIPQYQALWREQQAIRQATPAAEARPGLSEPDPRHMDPTRAFAAWPSHTFQFSQRLRPAPASADLRTLLGFTALTEPGKPDKAGIARLLDQDEAGIARLLEELHRRGGATAEELLEALEPAQQDAGRRLVLRLLRMGLAEVVTTPRRVGA